MAEHEVIRDIVVLITDHWDIFKYFFLGLGLKYIGEGLFQLSKASALFAMGIKKVFFNKD